MTAPTPADEFTTDHHTREPLMRCPECETENSEDSKFCMSCGVKLLDAPSAPVESAPAPIDEAPVPTVPVDPVPSDDAPPAVNPWLPSESATEPADPPLSPEPEPVVEEAAPPPPPVEAELVPDVPAHLPEPAPVVEEVAPPPEPEPVVEEAPASPEPPVMPAPPVGVAPAPPGVLPPPPGAEGWAPPAPPVGVPTSLMPPAGAAPVWQADPPPPGSYEPIAIPDPQAAVPQPIVMDTGPADPHGLARQLARIGDTTRPHAELPTLVAGALLRSSEEVEVIVPGLIDGVIGIALVTNERVLLINGRRWRPVVVDLPIASGLTLEGWQDETTAMLTFTGETIARIESIVDKSLAFEAARIVREHVAKLHPGA